jgi:hypothetical protein
MKQAEFGGGGGGNLKFNVIYYGRAVVCIDMVALFGKLPGKEPVFY